MAIFAKGVPRWAVLVVVLGAFALVAPERFAQGPDVCLWRHLFPLAACPACGSTRALAAFFHGRFAAAWAFNRNVVVTAPTLLLLVAQDLVHLLRRIRLCYMPFPQSPNVLASLSGGRLEPGREKRRRA